MRKLSPADPRQRVESAAVPEPFHGCGVRRAQRKSWLGGMAGYDVLLATHHRRSDLIAARARLMLERQVDGLIVADEGAIGDATVPVVRLRCNWDVL